jgi:hypothetical protein
MDEKDIKPRMLIPGYKTAFLFQDTFNENMNQWCVEGKGKFQITQDGRLKIQEEVGSQGVALWITKDFGDNIHLEYEIEIPETPGITTAILCAHGVNKKDILKDSSNRTGKLSDYIRGLIRSYHISIHCYTESGEHDPSCKIRKNPGHLLLSRVEPDPCAVNRKYLIDIIKLGSRIQLFVDGILVHDFRDKGGFGRPYLDGKIGFWFHGNPKIFKVYLDNVRVFKLIPN